MAASNLLSKCEQAVALYLQSVVTDKTILPGKCNTEKEAPCVLCNAQSASEDPPFTGNYWVSVEVEVKTEILPTETDSDPKPESDDLTASIIDALEQDDLAEQLSEQVDDFTAQGVTYEGIESGPEESHWRDSIRLNIYCCASDL